MSTISLVVLILVALWLGAVTLVTLLLVRQVGLITLRLDRADEGPALDGISVGSPTPVPLARLLADRNGAVSYVLVLGASCGPCRQLADELNEAEVSASVLALISGDSDAAGAIASRLPAQVQTILDPSASEAVDSLDLQTTPFVFTIQGGRIVGKDVIRNSTHFLQFVDHAADDDGYRSGPQPMEVTHVN